jgi:hypothetical protein
VRTAAKRRPVTVLSTETTPPVHRDDGCAGEVMPPRRTRRNRSGYFTTGPPAEVGDLKDHIWFQAFHW